MSVIYTYCSFDGILSRICNQPISYLRGGAQTPELPPAGKSTRWPLRSVSPDGRYVVLTAGVFYGLFVVDMLSETAEGYPSPEKMGRVFPVAEYWPSKP